MMKLLATVIAFAAFIAVGIGGFFYFQYARKEGPFRPRDDSMSAPAVSEQKAPAANKPLTNAPVQPVAPKAN
jgi:hypothetical protein